MSVSGSINHDEREPSCLDNENTISGVTIHLVARCLICTSEEAKQPLDTGLENSFMGGPGHVSQPEGSCGLPSHGPT